MKQLLVLGATGVMGRRIVALARRLLPGVRLRKGSRHARPDLDPDSRAVDVHDPGSLRAALAGTDAVINAVGPFEYDPGPLLRACAEAGCDYVDLAEPPEFIDRAEAAARSLTAGARPVRVLSGCSTVPGLVLVLVQEWAPLPEVQRVRVLLGFGTRNDASPTLLYSLLRPLGDRAPDGGRYFGRLVRKRLRGLPARLYGRYPSAFDRHGIRVGGRVLPATFHAGMDRGIFVRGLCLAAPLLHQLTSAQLGFLCRFLGPALPMVRLLGTPTGVLSLEALDRQGRLVAEIEVRAPRGGLTVPALPSVWAARRLLGPDPPGPGVLRLEQFVTPEQASTWLRQEGYEVVGVGQHGAASRPAPA